MTVYKSSDSYSLQGFDEYMNLVLDDAEEVSIKKKTRKSLGKIYSARTMLSFGLLFLALTADLMTLAFG